jgi:hypothetical protein
MLSTVEPAIAPHATSPSAERIGLRYLGILFIIPLAAFIFPYVAERSQFLQDATLSRLGQVLDYSYRATNQNADVVVFGDSAALYNIDPARLSASLGLKVINLPNTRDSLVVAGDETLRRYLRNNRPPRLIVFYFVPWDLNLDDPQLRFYDGEEMLFRHGTWQQIFTFAYKRPQELLFFPFRFYAAGSKLTDFMHADRYVPPVVVLGHVPYPGARPLPSDCVLPSSILQIRDRDFVEHLLTTFGASKTETLVILSPVPGCLHASEMQGRQYLNGKAAPPVLLAPEGFGDDEAYSHELASMVATSTEILEQAIRAKLLGGS